MKPALVPVLGLLFLLLVAGCAQPPAQPSVVPETPAEDPTPTIVEVPVTPTPPAEETTELPVEETPVEPAPAPEAEYFTLPQITYEEAYNGTLVDTSLQIGDADMDSHFINMNRNGVHAFIGFFGIVGKSDPDALANHEGLGYLLEAVQKHPGRVIPFFSLGWGADETALLPAKEILHYYQESYSSISPIAGDHVVRGIGEIELYGWPNATPNGAKMEGLVEWADEEGLHVMFHPSKGDVKEIRALVEAYPTTLFILHQFAEDFATDREELLSVMKDHPNVFFSVDMDHLMYDAGEGIGLLYQYEDAPTPKGVERFLEQYEEKKAKLLANAVARYKPLIVGAPDQVMWGTEMGPEYNFNPDVYDRIIEFSRKFIAKMPEENQERFAYLNAWKAFGPGSTLTESPIIADASQWPNCTNGQENLCATHCEENEEDITPATEACLLTCENKASCKAPLDD